MALLNIDGISNHVQLFSNSCIPMSVECILKLEQIIPMNDFRFQNDADKRGKAEWIDSIGAIQKPCGKTMLISRQFEHERNDYFLANHFNELFETIDEELKNGRFVVICLMPRTDGCEGSDFTLYNGDFHMYIIYGINEIQKTYAILDFDFNRELITYQNVDLINWVRTMKGTAIYTYTTS